MFNNINPTKDHWLSAGAGITGLRYTFVITSKYARIELAIISSSKEKNKKIFKQLINQKNEIEEIFGDSLEWEERPENKMSRIKYELKGVNLFDKDDWDKMNQFLIKYIPKFETALKPSIKKIK